jgi:hypothetical protein
LEYDLGSHEFADAAVFQATSETNYPTTVMVAVSPKQGGPWSFVGSFDWPAPALTATLQLPRTVSRYWQLFYGTNPAGTNSFASFELRTNTPLSPNQTYLQNAFQVTELRRPTHLAGGTLDLRGRVTQLFGFPDGDFTALFDSRDGLGGFSFLASAVAVGSLGAATAQLDIGAHDGVDSVTFKRIDQASAPYKVIISTSASADIFGTWQEIGTGDWTQPFCVPQGGGMLSRSLTSRPQ